MEWTTRFYTVNSWWEISYALRLIVLLFAFIPVVFTPLNSYVIIDPFSYTFHKMISYFYNCSHTNNLVFTCITWIVIPIFRGIGSIICAPESCRFYAILFSLTIQLVEPQVKSIELVDRIPDEEGLNIKIDNDTPFFKWYPAFHIAYKCLSSTYDILTAILMGSGFAIFVVCNLAT